VYSTRPCLMASASGICWILPDSKTRLRLLSTAATISVGALAPSADLILKPLYCAGLWLAVITTAAPACLRTVPKLTSGVGIALGLR